MLGLVLDCSRFWLSQGRISECKMFLKCQVFLVWSPIAYFSLERGDMHEYRATDCTANDIAKADGMLIKF